MTTTTTNENLAHETIEREWHILKTGDVVFFSTGWYKVFDAYMIIMNTLLLKLVIDGHIESYRVYVGGSHKATCRN